MKRSFFIIQLACALLFGNVSVLLAQKVTPNDSINTKGREYGTVSLYVNSTLLLQNRESIKTFLVSGNDTIESEYMKMGSFWFEKVPVGLVRAYAWADGFITDSDTLVVEKGKVTRKMMYLTDRVIQMKGIMVKGHTPAVVYRGDTIRFNPNNLNLSDDDMVRAILEQMPGVKISDTGINVMGKDVEKTYVDGKKIFGEDPMKAIDHVQATDVMNIYAYDEDEHKEQKKKNRRGRRRRVLNIETKSKMINSQDGNLLAGAGGNMGKQELSNHDVRYVGGGSFNFFSEQFLLSVNAMHNNENWATNNPQAFLRTNSPNPVYSVNSFSGFDLSRRWEKTPGFFKEIKGGYQFARTASETNRKEEREYQPTESFNSRSYQSQDYSANRKNVHTVTTGFGMNDEKWGRLNVNYSFSAQYTGGEVEQRIVNRVDELTSNGLLNKGNNEHHKEMKGSVDWSQYWGNWQYTLLAKWNHFTSDGMENRENDTDNGSLGSLRELLSISSDGLENNYYVESGLQWNFARNEEYFQRYIKGMYTFSKINNHINKLAWDKLTNELDETNTYGYHNLTTNHTAKLEVVPFNTAKWNISFLLGWQHFILEDEKKEFLSAYRKRFNVPLASVFFNFNIGTHSNSDISYDLTSQVPDIIQLRSEVSNTNPYFLSSGNPKLKETTVHSFKLHTNFNLNDYGRLINSQLTVSFLHNSIANYTRYFKEDTYLPEWNYTAMANSSFSSYENMNGAWKLDGLVGLDYPLDKIKSKFLLSLNEQYECTPYYYDEVRDVAHINRFSPSMEFSTNLIPKTFVSVRWLSSYQSSSSKVNDSKSRIWTNRLVGQLQFKSIAKYGFAKLYYVYRIQNNKTLQNKEVENVLNLYAGVKLFKRRGELSVTAYDLLHSYNNRMILMSDNYTSLLENENYGRYFSVNFTWTFRKIKSNRMDLSRGVAW